MFLRQSTSQIIRFGPCLDITDGVTEETALTLAQADMRLSKDGGAYAQKNTTGNATHDSDGHYSTTLDTTDTNTVGILKLNVHQPANMLPVWEKFYVVEEAVYDAEYAAGAAGPLQSTVAGRTLDVTALGTSGIDWGNIENPTTTVDLAGTDIQLVDTATTVTTLTGHTPQTGDNFARLGAPAGASVSADIAVIEGQTDDIGVAGAGLTAINLPNQTMDIVGNITGNLSGSVGSLTGHTVQTGDSFARLGAPAGASVSADILVIDNFVDGIESTLGTPTDFGSGTSTIAANLRDMADDGTAVFDRSTDSLQAIRDRGDTDWITGSAGSGLTPLDSGTLRSGGASSQALLPTARTFGDDILNGCVINLLTGLGAGQSRVITDYVLSSDTATVSPNWITNPDATTTYEIVQGSVNVDAWVNVAPNALSSGLLGTNVNRWNGTTVSIGSGFPNVTTAATATDAIDANGLATDAVTEIRDAITGGAYALDTDANGAIRIVDGTGARELNTNAGAIALVNTVTTLTGHTAQTGDSFARLGAPAGASVSADILVIDNFVDGIETTLGTPTDFGSGTSTLAANLQDMADDGTAVFDRSTDSLQAIRDRGDAAWTGGGTDRLLLQETTIATLSTQTSFTLTAGSANDNAYNNCTIVIEDTATAIQKAVGMVLDYVGSSRTVTLKEALAFTIATTDNVYILAENSLKSTVVNRQLDVTANGNTGIDWANVENPTTTLDLSATDINLVDTLTGHTPQTGDSFARLGAPAGASVSADIAVIETQTDDIGVAGAGLTDITINTASVDAVKDAILPVTNTALNNLVFVMVDDTDHVTAETGLTITTTRSIDGGAFGSGTGTAAEIGNGTYQYDASAADMNGTNIMFRFTGTDADDTFIFVRTGG